MANMPNARPNVDSSVKVMEKLLVIALLVIVVCEGRNHPKFPPEPKKGAETCSRAHEFTRNKIIDEAMCGDPKDMFVELQPLAANLQVMPGAVWVKRCVGLCYESGSNCAALETRTRQIPVRIFDAKTGRETCSWYPIEEHLKCGCCSSSVAERCESPRVYNPRKCTCQCPNNEQRRNCIHESKLNRSLKWNRSKCICEDRTK